MRTSRDFGVFSMVILMFFLGIYYNCHIAAGYSSTYISGMDVQLVKTHDKPELKISTSIVNDASFVKGFVLRVLLIRKNDDSIMGEVSKAVLLAPREVKHVEVSLPNPPICPHHTYEVQALLEESSGLLLNSRSVSLEIEDTSLFSTLFCECPMFDTLKPPHLLIEIQHPGTENIMKVSYIESYGSTGENIPQNGKYYVVFSVRGLKDGSTRFKIEVKDTYTKEIVDAKEGEIHSEEDEIKVPMLASKPGTYDIEISLFSPRGMFCGKQVVRAVVSGISGRVVSVNNARDVYAEGEEFNIKVGVVGPADGITVIPDAKVAIKVIKNGRVVLEDEKSVGELGSSVKEITFKKKTPESLDVYTVEIYLYAGDEVLDKRSITYRKVVPKAIITEDGRLRDLSIPCFDDGVCEEDEVGYNCLDCMAVKTTTISAETERVSNTGRIILILIILVLGAVGVLAILVLRKRRKVDEMYLI